MKQTITRKGMGWKIAKQFDFCYGHRVWGQKLNEEYSLTIHCKCRHLHGHQAQVIIYLESDKLNSQGMVVDFGNLQWFKQFLDDVVDHKFIIDKNDPLRRTLIPDDFYNLIEYPQNYWTLDLTPLADDYLIEYYESFVFVDFVPTSENLSKWFFDIVQEKMKKIGVKVSRVQFYETPKSQSQYDRLR